MQTCRVSTWSKITTMSGRSSPSAKLTFGGSPLATGGRSLKIFVGGDLLLIGSQVLAASQDQAECPCRIAGPGRMSTNALDVLGVGKHLAHVPREHGVGAAVGLPGLDRKVKFASDNREIAFVSLLAARTLLPTKPCKQYNGAGEEPSHEKNFGPSEVPQPPQADTVPQRGRRWHRQANNRVYMYMYLEMCTALDIHTRMHVCLGTYVHIPADIENATKTVPDTERYTYRECCRSPTQVYMYRACHTHICAQNYILLYV